jgi:hypothetical protein
MQKVLRMSVGAVVVLVALAASSPAFAQGAFDVNAVRDKIATNIPVVAGVLAMVAAVVVGGIAYYGSNNTGKWVGKFIVGTIFVLAATLAGDLLPALKEFFGIGR